MSKLPEDWCSRVIRGGLPTDAPPADTVVTRREAALVWHHLVQSGGAQACPAPVITALHQSSAARALEAELLNRELRRVLAAAQDAGVSVVTIKGAAIAHTHYPQPHLRPRGDSDIVILPRDRDALFHVLRTCGYTPSSAVDGDLVTRQGQWQLPLGRGLIHTLDVHWEIFNPHAFAGVLSVEEVLDRSVSLPELGRSARAPHVVHALLLACAHRVAHHAGDEDILWLYDIRLLAESLSEAEAHEFITLAATRRVSTVCADGLTAVRRVVGGRYPEALQSWIQSGTWRDMT